MFDRLRRLYDPPSFQGRGRKGGYFEGWYFKQSSPDGRVVALIPGISLSSDPHAFIQVNDGPARRSAYFRFPETEFRASGPGEPFRVEIGGNSFSRRGISLDLAEGGIAYRARMEFADALPYPPSLLSPGIMGWYAFMPFMECYHGLVSIDHGLSGRIRSESGEIDFTGGRGYIEKDWGRSFPESWIWMQSNLFAGQSASVMVSVARIPWLGAAFSGFLAFLRFGGRTRVFASYNGSRVRRARAGGGRAELAIERGGRRLSISAACSHAEDLQAPVDGRMERIIKESVDSRISVEFSDRRDGSRFSGTALAAGLEMVGSMDALLDGLARPRGPAAGNSPALGVPG